MARKYEKPPIDELIISAYFDPPLTGLRAEHIGLFWSEIRGDFPSVQQQPPTDGSFEAVPGEIFPLPRFWFVGTDDQNLLQIQRGSFFCNWRRRDGKYPHFDSVKKSFDIYFDKFLRFYAEHVDAEPHSIKACELTYVNLIDRNSGWNSSADTRSILPHFDLADVSFSGATLVNIKCQQTFRVADNLLVHALVQPRTHAKTGEEVLYLELRAVGEPLGGAKGDADKWYDAAHEAIGSLFEAMTSDVARNEFWLPQEG